MSLLQQQPNHSSGGNRCFYYVLRHKFTLSYTRSEFGKCHANGKLMDWSIQYILRYDQPMLSHGSHGPGQAVFVIRLNHKQWRLYLFGIYLFLMQLAAPRALMFLGSDMLPLTCL